MTVQELRRKITSSEFVMWIAFLEREYNEHNKLDYYLAQIAVEVRRSFIKHPEKIKLSNFLLKFETGEKVKLNRNNRMKTSKSFWKALVMGKGLLPKRKRK